jgi:Leucine-rich repeat (LRR) protein
MNKDERAAYDEALRRIEEVRKSGGTELKLTGYNALSGMPHLTALPPEISTLTHLTDLDFRFTQVSDLDPLREMTGLQKIVLHMTQVSDITPLSGMARLQSLFLSGTQVSDIIPLRGMTGLRTIALDQLPINDFSVIFDLRDIQILSLTGTQVTDLRPLLQLPKLKDLYFEDTPFAAATEKLTALAQLGADNKPDECAKQTIAYLKTLPPWPEPLPWEGQDQTSDREADGQPPGSKPAPLMVKIRNDGTLVSEPPAKDLDDAQEKRAKDAWDALQHYLSDLQFLKEKLDNRMPNLGRAFDSFKRALGSEFKTMNAIDLGIQSDRLRRLAVGADDYLVDQDPAELEAFVAALALYMRRFNSWEQYKDDPPPSPQIIEQLREDKDALTALHKVLGDEDHVDGAVSETLSDLTDAATAESSSALDARALLDSESNVFDQLAERSIKERKAILASEPGLLDKLHDESGAAFRAKVMESYPVAGSVWAFTFLFRNQGPINRLAQRYPDHFGFMASVLKHLFP